MADLAASTVRKGVKVVASRPYVTLGAVLASVVVALWMALGLGVQSSRHALVSPEHPYQARLLALVKDFGLPGDLIFWVQGGDEQERRQGVLELAAQLRAQPELAQASLIGPPKLDAWAPVFAVQNPGRLLEVLQGLGTKAEVRSALSQGLLGIIDRSYARMSDQEGQVAPDLKQMRQSGRLIAALEDVMLGRDLAAIGSEMIDQPGSASVDPGSKASSGAAAKGRTKGTVVLLDSAGYLRSDDASARLVVLSGVLDSDDGTQMQRVVDAARLAQANAQAKVAPGVNIRLSGYPVLQIDEQGAIAKGLLYSSIATGLAIILILALAFSSLRKSLIALIHLGVGAAMSLGALWLLFGQVNAITSSFLAVLLGLGIDISVHLLARVDEDLEEQGSEQGARIPILAKAFGAAGPAVMVGTVTTAIAFLLLYGAEFAAYGELGVITAVGLMLMLGAALVSLPALLMVWRGRQKGSTARARGQAWLARGCELLLNKAGVVLVLGALAAGLGAYLGSGLRFNPRYFDFMPRHFESVSLLERLERESAASPLAVSVRASSLQDASEKASALRKLKEVASVQSPSDLLASSSTDFAALLALRAWWPNPVNNEAPGPESLRAGVKVRAEQFVDLIDEQLFSLSMAKSEQQTQIKAELLAWKKRWEHIAKLAQSSAQSGQALERAQQQIERIRANTAKLLYSPSVDQRQWAIKDLAALPAQRFVAKREAGGLRLFVTPSGDFWAPGRAQAFLDRIEAVDPQSAGHSMSVIVHSGMIRRDFFRASAWALLAIALVLGVTFKSLKQVFFIILPLAMGWCWMLGVYALLGISLNVANIVVLPLVLGIGVDAGVHLMHRVQEESAQRVGIIKAVASTGSAITICSITTMAGFAGLMVAEYGGMKSLGLSMVIGICTTWLSTLLILPALLSVFSRRSS